TTGPTQLEREIAAYLALDGEYFVSGKRQAELSRTGAAQYPTMVAAYRALETEVNAVSNIPGILEDSAFQAATWLVKNTSLKLYKLEAEAELAAAPEGNAQKIVALETLCGEAQGPLCEAISYVNELKANEVTARRLKPYVEEPRRPSPEETQR